MTSYGDAPYRRRHRDWQAPETSADVAAERASRWGEAPDWTRGAATKQEQSDGNADAG